MLPRLFTLGPFTFYTYGVLLALGFLLGLWMATVRARSRGLDAARVLDLGVVVLLAALAGAKLLLLATSLPAITAAPRETLNVLRGGGVWYGGLVAAVAAGIWYMRRAGLPLGSTCDVLAPAVALGHAVGRLGCLAAGCCFGRPTTLPWAIVFHNPLAGLNSGTPLGVALHPTQLYEAAAEAIILVVLLFTERWAKPAGTRQGAPQRFADGSLFWLYLALYAVSRFFIEFYRGDGRGGMLGLSTSQLISMIIFPCSAVALVLLARRARRLSATAGSQHGRTAPAHR